jgi:hypothetical protein
MRFLGLRFIASKFIMLDCWSEPTQTLALAAAYCPWALIITAGVSRTDLAPRPSTRLPVFRHRLNFSGPPLPKKNLPRRKSILLCFLVSNSGPTPPIEMLIPGHFSEKQSYRDAIRHGSPFKLTRITQNHPWIIGARLRRRGCVSPPAHRPKLAREPD